MGENRLLQVLSFFFLSEESGCYGAADQYTADLLQRRKPMGGGLSDKSAGSIISVLPVCGSKGKKLRENVSEMENNTVLHRTGNRAAGAGKGQRYFVVSGWDIWYTFNVVERDKVTAVLFFGLISYFYYWLRNCIACYIECNRTFWY